MTKMKTRIAILNTHPIQYFAPLYAYLNASPDIEITALYLSDISLRGGHDAEFGQAVKWDIDLLYGYRSIFLGAAASRRVPKGFFSLIAPQLWRELRSGRYDILLIHGHNFCANHIALIAAKSAGVKVMIRGDGHLGLQRRRWKQLIYGSAMNLLYRAFDLCLAIGSANAAYYRAMGVPNDKIVIAPFAIDNDRFMLTLSDRDRDAWRSQFGIPHGTPAILYAGKFTHQKRPFDFLEAVRRLSEEITLPFAAVMCGSGALQGALRDFCQAHNLWNVSFPGFVNQARLPNLYAACDVFVLPADRNESWGLAVNEAMCASLSVVVSKEIGCVEDLVQDGVNGFTPLCGDVAGFTARLKQLIEDEALRKSQGAASLERISHWSYRECLNGFRDAVFRMIGEKN